MAFALFGPLFSKIDTAVSTFVGQISSNAISTITPFVTVGLTLGFIAYAIAIIRGAIDMPVMDFLARSVKIGIIVSIAGAGGLYQSQIADAITALPDGLATALISDPAQGSKAANIIDEAAGKGFDAAARAFEQSSFFSSDGLLYGIFGIIIIVATAVVVAIGGAFILLAKVAMALLAGIGPLFIFCFLWQPLAKLFDMWVGQVLNYVMLTVLFSSLFGLMMSIYGGFVEGVRFEEGVNVAYTLGGTLILSAAMVLVLLQLPGIASALAGGVSLSYMHELRALRSGASGVARGAKNAVGAGKKAAGLAGQGAKQAAKAGASGAGKALGYFKGKAA